MARVWFVGDLHLGHQNIANFRKEVQSCDDNTRLIEESWKEHVRKKDHVYVLGDVAMNRESLQLLSRWPGIKTLILGNHDEFKISEYMCVFAKVHGFMRYKEFWLSHPPIHANELRGKRNIHGHVHYASVDDARYVNVCVENNLRRYGRVLTTLEEIRAFSSVG